MLDGLIDLQKVGSNTNDSSKGTTGEGGTVGSTIVVRDVGGGNVVGAVGRLGVDGVLHRDVGVVRNLREISGGVASTRAVSLGDGGVGLGESAGAVSDGQGGGLSDGVGVVVLHDGGRIRAVGGVAGDHLGGSPRLVGVGRGDGDSGGSNGDDGRGTHFDWFGGGWCLVFLKTGLK